MIPPGQVTIHRIRPDSILRDEAAACLTSGELDRAARFRFEKDATNWMACRAGLRRILAAEIGVEPRNVPLHLSAHGKPLLSPPHGDLHFNLSHGPDLALVALCPDGPVGIDLEPLDRAPSLLGCETSFCHPEEIARLASDLPARSRDLLGLWTGKEAVLKALGTGLHHPPEKLLLPTVPDHPVITDPRLEGLANQRVRWLTHPFLTGFLAALSAPASVTRLHFAR